jgi:hypothetical protein
MESRRPETGTKRTRTRFLLTPLTIEGETRWLKRAKYEEEAVHTICGVTGKDLGWVWKQDGLTNCRLPNPRPCALIAAV